MFQKQLKGSMPGTQPANEADYPQDSHQTSNAKHVDVRNAGDQIDPTQPHKLSFVLGLFQPNKKVDQEQHAHDEIGSLQYLGNIWRNWSDSVDQESHDHR